MNINILNVNYNRNGSGVCEGFFAVLFEAKSVGKEWDKGVCGPTFIATFRLDESPERIVWDSFRVMNVKNFSLSFRGDHFITSLTDAIVPYCIKLGLRENTFCAAAFPSQYQKEPSKL